MGIAPLQYLPGESTESHGLSGKEAYTIEYPDNLGPGSMVTVKVRDLVFDFFSLCKQKHRSTNATSSSWNEKYLS